MPNHSTTSLQGVRPRTAAQCAAYWAEKAKNIPTLEGSRSGSGSKEFKDLDGSRSQHAHKIQVSCAYPEDVHTEQPFIVHENPDGLDHLIKGKYEKVLKTDPDMLKARSWKCHPATLSAAFNRMGIEWVRQQISFVEGNPRAKDKGRYLAAVISRNKV